MKIATIHRIARASPTLCERSSLFQYHRFQLDSVPRDTKPQPKKYKYPAFYDPYGPRAPPSDKIVQLAEKIASLLQEERMQIGPTLQGKIMLPMLETISGEGMDMGPQAGTASSKTEEKAEKTSFDIKLEKFDKGATLKVIKEIRSFTDLGLKEAKDLVEKVPVILKKQVTKDEANGILEKIKAADGVAVMEWCLYGGLLGHLILFINLNCMLPFQS